MTVEEARKAVIVLGVALVALGVFLPYLAKLDFFGKLPGDIKISGENYSFYFPLATCVVLSVVLSLVLGFFGRK